MQIYYFPAINVSLGSLLLDICLEHHANLLFPIYRRVSYYLLLDTYSKLEHHATLLFPIYRRVS